MEPIISVRGLGKSYRIQSSEKKPYHTLRDDLVDFGKGIFKGQWGRSNTEEFWALKDVDFNINPGDVVGVIGRNGAGKSTLLKILARVIRPTVGTAIIKGRIAPLLEVGTGFHPELTGRENIFMSGAILGMTHSEIKRKFDEIVAFAETERFLDTPVKRYSSGMYVRLAFAIAAHLEPEILIVDEVLAVGDISFQQKCLGKMQEVSKQNGKTVFFVSHNMDAVRKLCHWGILLEKGSIVRVGNPTEILKQYIEIGQNTTKPYEIEKPTENISGHVQKVIFENSKGKPTSGIAVGESWQIRIYFEILRELEHFIIALGLRSSKGVQIRTSWSSPMAVKPGIYTATFRENHILMAPDFYTIMIGLSDYERTFQYIEDAGSIKIEEFTQGIDLVRISDVGIILNPFNISIQEV
jgi:lipopolysaccharide transport system ATP-binding protein